MAIPSRAGLFPFRHPTALIGAAALLFPACSNIKNDAARTKTEGALAGSAGGAVLGALIGAVAGMGSPDYIARGALIGAGVGGGAGYAYGASVAHRKKEYASREAHLDACIAELKQKTAKSRDYNALALRVLARQQRQLAALRISGKIRDAKAPETAALRANVEQSAANIGVAEQAWEYTLQAHREVVARTRPDARTLELKGNIQQLETEESETSGLRRQFEELKQQLPVATAPQ